MSGSLVERVVNAVLYEGYVLYPYRPSVKSRHRWTFGGLYPRPWSIAEGGTDPASLQMQCIVAGDGRAVVDARVRFLHVVSRSVAELEQPITHFPSQGEPAHRIVSALRVGATTHQPWQEATEREIVPGSVQLASLVGFPIRTEFSFPAERKLEPLQDDAGTVIGMLIRECQALQGEVEFSAESLGFDRFRLTARVANTTAFDPSGFQPTHALAEPDAQDQRDKSSPRDEAVLRSFASTHVILNVVGGSFVSMTDPPASCRDPVGACSNTGVWPVLVGEAPDSSTMLGSPIILYDYPQIAPESPGDLFDGTEIDEILTLRILTLTDDEKATAAAVDSRARLMLRRTESLGPEQMAALHGTFREGDAT